MIVRRARTINRDEGLYICPGCDWKEAEGDPGEPEMGIKRGSDPIPLPPEESFCSLCQDRLVDMRKIGKKLRAMGSLSDKDLARIRQEMIGKGWREIGKGQRAHNKCLRERRAQ